MRCATANALCCVTTHSLSILALQSLKVPTLLSAPPRPPPPNPAPWLNSMELLDKAVYTEKLIGQVQGLIDQGCSSGEKVGAWENISDLLLQHGVAHRATSPANRVGVHPPNRSSFGIAGTDAQARHLWHAYIYIYIYNASGNTASGAPRSNSSTKVWKTQNVYSCTLFVRLQVHGSRIWSVGWCWQKCADATAFQCPPPTHKASTEAREFNRRIVARSDRSIPPVQDLQLLSIGSGHTNTLLRQVLAGVATKVGSYSFSVCFAEKQTPRLKPRWSPLLTAGAG